jgi:ligand-binding sensor domain-containing protein/anti-sigma regulatory factor (Ser/Thr protein kinase)
LKKLKAANIKIVGTILIVLCTSLNLYSQSHPFRHFTVEDGLPTSETYHVFQDSKGYIWIATDNGVSRYDGYEFKNFTTEDGLPDNTVFEIFEDYKNRIWFIPHSAKLSYFFNDSIIKYEYNDSLQKRMIKTPSPVKLSFFVDSSNKVYYSDKRNGTFLIDSSGRISKTNSELGGKRLAIYENKMIFIGGSNPNKIPPTFSIQRDGDTIFKSSTNSPITNHLNSSIYLPIIKNNNILIACNKILIHIKNLSEISFKLIPYEAIWISLDREDNLWLGTRNSVYCFDGLDITSKPKHQLLKNKNVSSVLHDKEGGYWFSTLYDGVYYLPNIYTNILNKNNGLPSNNIHTLTSDSSHIWLGLYKKVIGIKSQKINKKLLYNNNHDMFISKLLYDSKNQKLWIASAFLYFYQNDRITKPTIHKTVGHSYKQISPKDILIDNTGNMWLASIGGLFQYKNNSYVKASGFSHKINTISQKLKEDKILCGCNNGLWEYSINANSFKYLGEDNNLFSNQIDCIISNTYHNNMWLGTKANGIIVYDNDEIYNIGTKEGLSNNSITSFYLKENVMWVTTNNGLNKITFHDKKLKYSYNIESFSKIHGLASNQINDIYVSDTSAYVATKKGLTIIDINKISRNNLPPPIYIKNISIQGKDTLIYDHYILPYNKNSIGIEFVGLMYRNNVDKRYKYQFNQTGKNSTWIETKENYINLSYLSSGNYTFKVIAINEDNTESRNAASISFTITPPYWKKWWFISISIVLILLIASLLYNTRIKELNKRNNKENKLIKEVNKFRQQALRQQMNPHFIFNTLNSIQYYIYENDNVSSTRYLAKFSKLMRIILDNLQYDTIPIQSELDAMDLYLELESLRLEKSFNYKIIVHEDVDTQLIKIYPLLIQPYIENSIWHGLVHKKGDKKVTLEIKTSNNSILCIIEDNGIGREKAQELKNQKHKKHKSHGTNITNKRIETINKLYNQNFKVEFIDLKDSIGNPCGTRVLIQIPKITD